MNNKNPTIDIVKGIAILLVVYGHVIEHGMVPQGGNFFLNPVFKIIYTFHMPLFVFISGYLMASSVSRRSLGEVFRGKCQSLLVPFVALSILGVFVSYCLNGLLGKDPGSVHLSQDLLNQLLLNPSVWFLLTLFVSSALLLYSIYWAKRFGKAIFFGIYCLLLMIPYNDYCCLYYIKWFYVFFLAGYLVYAYDVNKMGQALKQVLFWVAVILFIGLMPFWTTGDFIYIHKMHFASHRYFNEMVRMLYRYLMGFLGILMSFYIGAFLTKIKEASFLGQIGRYSLDIYIIQMFIVEGIYPRLIGKLHMQVDFNSPGGLYIVAPLLVAVFTALCLIISKLIIRQNSLLSRLLLGGRA